PRACRQLVERDRRAAYRLRADRQILGHRDADAGAEDACGVLLDQRAEWFGVAEPRTGAVPIEGLVEQLCRRGVAVHLVVGSLGARLLRERAVERLLGAVVGQRGDPLLQRGQPHASAVLLLFEPCGQWTDGVEAPLQLLRIQLFDP